MRSPDARSYWMGGKKDPESFNWVRCRTPIGADAHMHQVILAYASDMNLLSTAMRPHGVHWQTEGFQSASLDHAMWFHKPTDFNQWHLYHQDSPRGVRRPRRFIRGSIYAEDGTLVALRRHPGRPDADAQGRSDVLKDRDGHPDPRRDPQAGTAGGEPFPRDDARGRVARADLRRAGDRAIAAGGLRDGRGAGLPFSALLLHPPGRPADPDRLRSRPQPRRRQLHDPARHRRPARPADLQPGRLVPGRGRGAGAPGADARRAPRPGTRWEGRHGIAARASGRAGAPPEVRAWLDRPQPIEMRTAGGRSFGGGEGPEPVQQIPSVPGQGTRSAPTVPCSR